MLSAKSPRDSSLACGRTAMMKSSRPTMADRAIHRSPKSQWMVLNRLSVSAAPKTASPKSSQNIWVVVSQRALR